MRARLQPYEIAPTLVVLFFRTDARREYNGRACNPKTPLCGFLLSCSLGRSVVATNVPPKHVDKVRFFADLPSECRRGLHLLNDQVRRKAGLNVFDILVALLLRDAIGAQPHCL